MCAKRWRIKNKQKNNEDADDESKKMDAMPQWFAFMLNSVVHMEQQETTFTLEKSEGLRDFCRLGRLPQHLHYTKWVMWQNHSEASKSYWSFKSTLVFKQSKVIWKLWYSSGNLKWNNLHSGLKTKIIVEIWTLIQLRWHGLVWVLLIPSAKPPLKEFSQKHAYWKREEFRWRCTVHRTLFPILHGH